MKKTSFFAATALLSVLLASGQVVAATSDAADDSQAQAVSSSAEKTSSRPMRRAQRMPDAARDAIHGAMSKVQAESKALMEELNTKRTEMEAIIKAPTFDKAAFMAKGAEIDAIRDKLAVSRRDALGDAFSTLSAEDRANMASMHENRMQHRGKRGSGLQQHGRGPMMDDDDMPMTKEKGAASDK